MQSENKTVENTSDKFRSNLNWILTFIGKSLLILIGLVVLKTMDFSWIKGEVMGYTKSCSKWSANDDCLLYHASSLKRTYKVNANNQTVFELSKYGTDKYTKCTVVDDKNWECKYDDESGKFGFRRGKYFSYGLEPDDYYTWDKLFQEDIGLSRFEWLIQKNIDSGCIPFDPLCYLIQ